MKFYWEQGQPKRNVPGSHRVDDAKVEVVTIFSDCLILTRLQKKPWSKVTNERHYHHHKEPLLFICGPLVACGTTWESPSDGWSLLEYLLLPSSPYGVAASSCECGKTSLGPCWVEMGKPRNSWQGCWRELLSRLAM